MHGKGWWYLLRCLSVTGWESLHRNQDMENLVYQQVLFSFFKWCEPNSKWQWKWETESNEAYGTPINSWCFILFSLFSCSGAGRRSPEEQNASIQIRYGGELENQTNDKEPTSCVTPSWKLEIIPCVGYHNLQSEAGKFYFHTSHISEEHSPNPQSDFQLWLYY